jgi:hypothetical protein
MWLQQPGTDLRIAHRQALLLTRELGLASGV